VTVIDERSAFGARAARHLREDVVVWLTTVTPQGAPVPRPVWFVWDGEDEVLVFSLDGPRVANLKHNPRVTLNFPGDGRGGDIVVLSGRATVEPDAAKADEVPAYVDKYADHIAGIGHTPASFAENYRVPLRVRLSRLSGH
jgi:PPOX class probable F420-dependent enzyme